VVAVLLLMEAARQRELCFRIVNFFLAAGDGCDTNLVTKELLND